jgi:hypothetical protein
MNEEKLKKCELMLIGAPKTDCFSVVRNNKRYIANKDIRFMGSDYKKVVAKMEELVSGILDKDIIIRVLPYIVKRDEEYIARIRYADYDDARPVVSKEQVV